MRTALRRLPRVSCPAAATVISGAVLTSLAILYRSGAFREIDRATLLWLRGNRDQILDVIAREDDVYGRALPTFAAALVMAVLLLAWRRGGWAWIVPLFIVFTGALEYLAKLGFSRGLHLGELLAALRDLLGFRYHTGAGFPSGHVARTAFLAVVAVRLFPSVIGVLFVLFAAVTFGARLYTEAHRVSDVLGGSALGVFVASGALWSRSVIERRRARRKTR